MFKLLITIITVFSLTGCDMNERIIAEENILKENFINGKDIVCYSNNNKGYKINNTFYVFSGYRFIPMDKNKPFKTFNKNNCSYILDKKNLRKEQAIKVN